MSVGGAFAPKGDDVFLPSFLTARYVAVALIPAALIVGGAELATAATYVTFDPANGNGTSPYAINAQGVVSGSYMGSGGKVFAFLRAPGGTITTYTVPGAELTFGVSINGAGTVAGSYRFSDNKNHGFVRASDGTITTFDVPGADETVPRAIDGQGTVTGSANKGTLVIGFVRTPSGTITVFQVPGETGGTVPLSINVRGEITGYYCCIVRDGLTVSRGFVRHVDGSFTTFRPPHMRGTLPMRIVWSGAIAGFCTDMNDNYHGFIRANGAITTFDVPEGSQTEPTAMNPNEIIAGYYENGAKNRGFLFDVPKNKFTEFDVPGSSETFPVAINRNGLVTGSYYPSAGGSYKGFVRIP